MIYLDHAAATPVCAEALMAMQPYYTEKFFNPSAAYLPAKEVAAEYAAAKGRIAHVIGARGADLVITAGATEANNLAMSVVGAVRAKDPLCSSRHASSRLSLQGSSLNSAPVVADSLEESVSLSPQPPASRIHGRRMGGELSENSPSAAHHILYLATEHDSVRQAAEARGGATVNVRPNGVVDLEDLRRKLTDEVGLISIALVNGEVGTVQPLAEVAALVREVRLDRLRRGVRRPLWLHSDASQALNLLEVNVARLGVDLMSLNAAKVYGPKGVGALYVGRGVRLGPASYGGGQERGLRAGTENVPGVMGMAAAVERAHQHLHGNRKKYAEWKRMLLAELEGYELIVGGGEGVRGTAANRGEKAGEGARVLDNFVNVCYNGIDGERLVYLLEERGVYVATGAACAASKGERSHVLAAMGFSREQIAGSLRLTLGETNSTEQIHQAARIINAAVAQEYRRIE